MTRGAGLGLTFCKQMIERLGGSIWFDSEHNKGSTFYIKFPVKVAKKADVKDNQAIGEKSIEMRGMERLSDLQVGPPLNLILCIVSISREQRNRA